MNYNEAVQQVRISHPNWDTATVENAAKAAVLAQEKQAAADALAEAVTAATDESGNFDWSKVEREPAWYDDAHPNADFNANVIVGLEATAETFKARGDAAEKAERTIQENLRTGNIGPSQRSGRL